MCGQKMNCVGGAKVFKICKIKENSTQFENIHFLNAKNNKKMIIKFAQVGENANYC